jgi:8-oxo-dGTP diphosphatase
MSLLIPSVGGILVEGKSVLLVKRKNPPCRGFWSIPGGRQKPGETAFQAIVREMLEETGVLVEPIGVFGVIELIPKESGKAHYVIVEFVLRRVSGSLRAGSDAEDARFFPMDQLPENTGLATREIVSELLKSGGGFLNNCCRYRVFEIEHLCEAD